MTNATVHSRLAWRVGDSSFLTTFNTEFGWFRFAGMIFLELILHRSVLVKSDKCDVYHRVIIVAKIDDDNRSMKWVDPNLKG